MPNPFSANYTPGQAVSEYQAQLKAQKARDADTTDVETLRPTYDLAERVPDWNQLRNMGAGQYGLAMYSNAHLEEALVNLHNTDLFDSTLDNRYFHFTRAEQIERIHAELVSHID